ncbi:MAG: hypothetical protein NW205_13415 [Hyphomicrobiaceae bacterium]|nr:hypothetical protein [Hyphomicrobiaceae bacterium]
MKAPIAALLTSLAIATAASEASAYDMALARACMGDYMSYCSQHKPTSPGMNACFRANGTKLSQGCKKAVVAGGYASAADVGLRQAAK